MRNYRAEYDNYQGSLKQKKRRAKRNAARRKMIKLKGKSKLKGMDVDHIHGVGRGNSMSNLRVISKSLNRSLGGKK